MEINAKPKQTRMSLKGMSDEEKKERKKVMMREYMLKRRHEDPQFAAQQRELMKNYRQTDKYKEYMKENNKDNCAKQYVKRKETIRELQEKIKLLEIKP